MNKFKSLDPESIKENPFKLIGDEWMLISAGELNSFNTMTASWGGFGILWHKAVVFCFIRPQRYTYEFVEKHDNFSLCFFEREYRNALTFCGTQSGRDADKMKATGLVPALSDNNCIYFEQSKLVIECRKIYFNDLDPTHFIENKIYNEYPAKDYHRMYIGEIINCMEQA